MTSDITLVRLFLQQRINPTPKEWVSYGYVQGPDYRKLEAYRDVLAYIRRIETMYEPDEFARGRL